MKHLTLMILIFFLVDLTAQPTDYLAYYKCSDLTLLTDESINNFDGTIEGGTIFAVDRFGNANNAFQFNGNDAYLDLTAHLNSINDYTNGTLSFWFKADIVNGGENIFGGFKSTHNHIFQTIGHGFSSVNNIQVSHTMKTGSMKLKFTINPDPQGGNYLDFTDGEWHNYTLVVGPSGNSVFIDGNMITEMAYFSGTNANVNTHFLNIADGSSFGFARNFYPGFETFYSGALDDIRIYTYALTQSQIDDIVNEPSNAGENNSGLGLWELTNNTIHNSEGTVVGINTDTTFGYDLAVNGNVIAKEYKATLTGVPWADYVFEIDYDLLSIDKLSKFIQKNGHLPGVPSSSDVSRNGGVNIGRMNVLLLEKIEELTLHIIQLNGRLNKQELIIKKQQSDIELLKDEQQRR